MTLPKDDEYSLSYKDVRIFARQLGAIAIEEYFKAGKFDVDIAKFAEKEQRRIRGEVKQLIRNLNGLEGGTLPPEKPGRPRKQDTHPAGVKEKEMDKLKIVKHRASIAPFECNHCGLLWYGLDGAHKYAPGQTLCIRCWDKLDTYLLMNFDEYSQVRRSEDERKAAFEKLHGAALLWIQDKGHKPYPLTKTKRFDVSVPKWMRSAIDAGLIKTNGEGEVYIIYTQDNQVVKVEPGDASMLSPW